MIPGVNTEFFKSEYSPPVVKNKDTTPRVAATNIIALDSMQIAIAVRYGPDCRRFELRKLRLSNCAVERMLCACRRRTVMSIDRAPLVTKVAGRRSTMAAPLLPISPFKSLQLFSAFAYILLTASKVR